MRYNYIALCICRLNRKTGDIYSTTRKRVKMEIFEEKVKVNHEIIGRKLHFNAKARGF